MRHYIDGFVHPIPSIYVEEYKAVAETIAEIWKEYGALEYYEFVGDDLILEGTRSFVDSVSRKEHEVVLFGWVFSHQKKCEMMQIKKFQKTLEWQTL